MKLKKTSLRYIIEIHLHAVRWKRVCNRLHSNLLKINKRFSWKMARDLILTTYMERSNETCSTDISPHGLQAGELLLTKYILTIKIYPRMAVPPCSLPYLDFKSQQLSLLLFALPGPTWFAQATEWNPWAKFCYRFTAEIGLKPMDLPQIYTHRQNEFLAPPLKFLLYKVSLWH